MFPKVLGKRRVVSSTQNREQTTQRSPNKENSTNKSMSDLNPNKADGLNGTNRVEPMPTERELEALRYRGTPILRFVPAAAPLSTPANNPPPLLSPESGGPGESTQGSNEAGAANLNPENSSAKVAETAASAASERIDDVNAG